MLVFLVLNPHVLHADMACVTASNQHMPDILSSRVVTSVRPTYTIIKMRTMTWVRYW